MNIKEQLKQIAPGTNGEGLQRTSGGFISGGTDLYVQKHEELKDLKSRFLLNQSHLKGIYKDGNRCVIGGSATVTDLAESPVMQEYFPRLVQYIKLISSTPIRNIATIAGNFINASPIGDLTIFFLALNATLVLSDGKKSRELLLKNLYKGYKILDKTPDEYIEKVWFELPGKNTCFHFEKVSKRTFLDIASVNSAISLTIDGSRITEVYLSAGGVSPVPLFLTKTADFLKGKDVKEETIEQAMEVMQAEVSPITDVRGSAEYKRLLIGQLIKAHFIELFHLTPALS
jgi:xanthine dehydrogenase small subunit